jgi:hypothetical protein
MASGTGTAFKPDRGKQKNLFHNNYVLFGSRRTNGVAILRIGCPSAEANEYSSVRTVVVRGVVHSGAEMS